MNRFIFPAAVMAAYVTIAPAARGAEVATQTIAAMVQQVDSISFNDLITRTAGSVNPSRISEYAGDFDEYWKRARVNFEGKTFEAIVADTTNARNKAVRDAARLVPNAMLGNHTAPADLLFVKSPGATPTMVQAKLGAGGALDALGDPKYRGMDIATCRESLDELVARLKKEAAKATRRGLPLPPEYQRLKDAIDSGRLWEKLPCGAPLPERSYVEAVARKQCQAQWTATVKDAAAGADDAARVVTTANNPVRGAPAATKAITPKAATVAKEAATQAGGAVDDVAMTLGKTVVWWAGPVTTVYEVGNRGYRVYTTEAKFAAGEISQEKREVQHAGNAGGAAGGVGGATGGAWGGAAVGSMICPGIGTVAGGVVGGIGGAIGGSYAGQVAAEAAMGAVHATGTTVRGVARWTGKRLYGAYRWATPW
jgi:hypothetical protein